MVDLSGKTIVITGGTRGFGFEIARAALQFGGRVFISSRSQSAVDAALQQLASPGQPSDRAAGIAADVTDMHQVQALSTAAITTFGSYQVWINNAGISGPYGPAMKLDPAEFTAILNTNIHGAYHGSQVAMTYFLKQGAGKLINILGRGYKGPEPFQSAYSSSKAWLRSFTMSLAGETRNPGIGIFAFNPGMMLTDLLTNVEVIEGSQERLKSFPAIIRLLARHPAKAAQKAVWIASSATDGKSGKLYSMTSSLSFFTSLLRLLWQKITRQPAEDIDLQIQTVAPYQPD